MLRKIIEIDQDKCDGCGICVSACHEHAIEIVEGKAKLIKDDYCDGLGDCLPACPRDAIKMVERETVPYDEVAVAKRQAMFRSENQPMGCPGMASKSMIKKPEKPPLKSEIGEKITSELNQWPVQIKLVNPTASYLRGADLLVAADCTAYAYGNIHKDFIKGRVTLIGCPKLDDNNYYKEKLTEILKQNEIKSLTVLRMEVPCCGGIVSATRDAILKSQRMIPYKEVIITIDGQIKEE